MLFPGLFKEFIHEFIIGGAIAALMYPFRKLKKAWEEATAKLDTVHKELILQRTNCLSTIQNSNQRQVELLGKAVDVLDEMRLDQRATLEVLRDRRT